MIVQLTGNITYPITLDPTVWIFDDRKIKLEEAFNEKDKLKLKEKSNAQLTSERLEREIYPGNAKPPVNKSLSKKEREDALKYSYVMPIKHFLDNIEIKSNASKAVLISDSRKTEISLMQLKNCFLLFSVDGKPLSVDGPVHLLFHDGSNKSNPIKGIKKIDIQ
ncbi:hypothetical protein ACFFIS_12020 [Virgibacillus soli]|uniref:hypothetical protein n=1 Tax=Paracerasibacillus soli TaxID=480284 RepID=UPI0035EF8772